jgi:YYY domain-containing protein
MEFGLVLVWLVAYALLGAAGVPIAARLFPRLAGRGAGFALPVALVVLTTATYWVGHIAFGPIAVAAGVLTLGVAAAVAGLDRAVLREGSVALAPDLDLDRAAIRDVGAVFLAAFLFLVAVRNADPAVHAGGGEKFLDYGLLKTLDRSTALPPEDMWFAGEPVRYYYAGHLMASILGDLTFTATRYTYNLALAGFYAMLVAAAFDLAGALAAARGVDRRLGGGLAVFFVGVASNLAPPIRLLISLLPTPLRRPAATALATAAQDYEVDMVLSGAETFTYWDASRVVPGTINEFPLFAWLNGDLHAHMMGTPFVLLGAALAFSYYLTPASERRRRRLLVFGAVPVLAGLQAVLDTWSFPTLFGLLWLALAFAPADPRTLLPGGRALGRWGRRVGGDGRLLDETGRVVAAGAVAAIAGLVGAALASPFLLSSAGGREVAALAPGDRSGFGALLLVHGAFVLAFVLHLTGRFDRDSYLPLSVGVAAVTLVALSAQLHVAAVAVPLLVAGWVALRTDCDVGFETVLIVGGAGLVAIVELLYVKEQAGPGRMNTVFKTYMQVWVLWGTAAAAVLAEFLQGRSLAALPRPAAGAVKRVVVAALVLSTASYGVLAVGTHFTASDWNTLDATQFTERHHPDEADAIAWLDRREGQPTMVSAPATARYPLDRSREPAGPGIYRWRANPAASLTGVPTLAGWNHEVGYRGPDAYFARVRDADQIYVGTSDERVAMLERYEVDYVWLGPSERLRYGENVSFANVSGVAPVYEDESVTVYAVDRSELGAT